MTDTKSDRVRYQAPKYQLDARDADLVAAANSATKLMALTSPIAHYLVKEAVNEEGPVEAHDHPAEAVDPPSVSFATSAGRLDGILEELVRDLDQQYPECERLVTPLLQEFSASGGGYAEGGVYATSAFEAAAQYAIRVRRDLDLVASAVVGDLGGWRPDEFRTVESLRGRWGEVRKAARGGWRYLFNELPPTGPLYARIGVEVFKAAAARGRAGVPPSGRPPVEFTTPDQEMKRIVGLLSPKDLVPKLAVVADTGRSTHEKMEAIYAIDPTSLVWDSPRWAEVLGVSASAVRQTDWWNIERPRLRGHSIR